MADPSVSPNEELAAVENYVIRINGKEVWRSKGKALLVDKVTMNNARGEITVVGSHNDDKYLDINVNERSYDDPATYLDMIDAEKAQERRDRLEPAPDKTREGYVEADPETGQPIEETRVPMKEDSDAEEAAETPEEEAKEDETPAPALESVEF